MTVYILNIKELKSIINKYIKNSSNHLKLSNFFVKLLISNNKIYYNKFGKPYIKNGYKFSISHSGDYITIIVSEKIEVGIDIEKIKQHNKFISISKKYFKNEENIYINYDIKKFLLIWTRKESFIKCLGLSILQLTKIPCIIKNKIIYKNNLFYVKTFFYKNYFISVTYKSSIVKRIKIKEIHKNEIVNKLKKLNDSQLKIFAKQ